MNLNSPRLAASRTAISNFAHCADEKFQRVYYKTNVRGQSNSNSNNKNNNNYVQQKEQQQHQSWESEQNSQQIR